MKISIGDIVDRYTICNLKKERLKIDNTSEINALRIELSGYEGIDSFIENLYEVNGKIWDLESDIRKGNEDILGLEEIGRRSLNIRDLNKIRVDYKNQLNSKFNEGFIEYKINHGSEIEKSIVISLTTVPERLNNPNEDGLKLVLKSLCTQKDNDYEIHFNIPNNYNITNEKYEIPTWMDDYKLEYPNLKIFRTEDLGPPTKFVPTIQRITNPDTIILVVDDDLVYHEEMVSEHRKYQEILLDSVIGYDGRGCEIPLFNHDIRDSWIICVTQIRETHSLQHYKSVSYKKKLFDVDFFTDYLGKTLSDDILISKYFRNNSVKMYVVPYEKDNHLFDTKEKWDLNQGVTSFPVLRYASSVENTGCNHPELLKLQPKFYEPSDLNIRKKKKETNYEFFTDKINHGYMEIYDPLFKEKKGINKILEIGVYQGESLKLFSNYFPDSTIYGFDVTDCSHLNNEKIKIFKGDQENIQDLNEFIKVHGTNFDLILDDGGHSMKQQQTSFGFLFQHLKPGGIYIIEDLHTSKISGYKTENDSITTLDMLTMFKITNKITSNHINKENISFIENNIESIQIWGNPSDLTGSITSIIKKK